METEQPVLHMCGGLIPVPVCSLFGSSVSAGPCWLRLIDSMFSCGLLDFSGSSNSPPLLPQDDPSSDQCLVVGPCICFHQLLGEAPQVIVRLGFCLQVQQSIITSVRGGFPLMARVSIWEGIGWPLPQFLPHLYPCTSCRQDKL